MGELNELQGSRVYEHLKSLLNEAIEEIDNAPTDRIANIAIGKRRALKDLIESIDTALSTFQSIREAEAKKKTVDMKKTF